MEVLVAIGQSESFTSLLLIRARLSDGAEMGIGILLASRVPAESSVEYGLPGATDDRENLVEEGKGRSDQSPVGRAYDRRGHPYKDKAQEDGREILMHNIMGSAVAVGWCLVP
jgi:hypothetical protein